MATDLFTTARERLDNAARYLDIEREVIEQLRYPKETLAATLLVRMGRRLPQGVQGVAVPL